VELGTLVPHIYLDFCLISQAKFDIPGRLRNLN